jgi:hypothetical protein
MFRSFVLLLPALAILLASCASAGTGPAHTSWVMALDLQAAGEVTVGVWDNREDVVNGERQASWVGLTRSLYGIPYGVTTPAGQPFAEVLNGYLVRSLQKAGIDAEPVALPAGRDREDVVKVLSGTGRPRLLLFQLDEWYSDTYVQTTLHYDITLEVLDARGTAIAKTWLSGEDDLGPRMRDGRRSIPEATEDILRTLLTRDAIVEALASTDAMPTESERRCTVDQILQMRESGLSEDQIRAACGEGN